MVLEYVMIMEAKSDVPPIEPEIVTRLEDNFNRVQEAVDAYIEGLKQLKAVQENPMQDDDSGSCSETEEVAQVVNPDEENNILSTDEEPPFDENDPILFRDTTPSPRAANLPPIKLGKHNWLFSDGDEDNTDEDAGDDALQRGPKAKTDSPARSLIPDMTMEDNCYEGMKVK